MKSIFKHVNSSLQAASFSNVRCIVWPGCVSDVANKMFRDATLRIATDVRRRRLMVHHCYETLPTIVKLLSMTSKLFAFICEMALELFCQLPLSLRNDCADKGVVVE